MTEPSSDSPFAAFAAPKPSAVECLKAQREQDRKARRGYWLFLAILAGGAALAAAGGASVTAGLRALPAALGLAIVGTLLGGLVGWLAGAANWAALSTRFKGISMDLAKGNSWDKMSVWLSVWGAIGIALGGAVGASQGAVLAAGVPADSVMPWALGGAVGALGVSSLWLLIRRAGRRA